MRTILAFALGLALGAGVISALEFYKKLRPAQSAIDLVEQEARTCGELLSRVGRIHAEQEYIAVISERK